MVVSAYILLHFLHQNKAEGTILKHWVICLCISWEAVCPGRAWRFVLFFFFSKMHSSFLWNCRFIFSSLLRLCVCFISPTDFHLFFVVVNPQDTFVSCFFCSKAGWHCNTCRSSAAHVVPQLLSHVLQGLSVSFWTHTRVFVSHTIVQTLLE